MSIRKNVTYVGLLEELAPIDKPVPFVGSAGKDPSKTGSSLKENFSNEKLSNYSHYHSSDG